MGLAYCVSQEVSVRHFSPFSPHKKCQTLLKQMHGKSVKEGELELTVGQPAP